MKAHEVEEVAADIASYGAAFWLKAAVFAVAWIAGMSWLRFQMPLTEAGEPSPILSISWNLLFLTPAWLWVIHVRHGWWRDYLVSFAFASVVSIPGFMATWQTDGPLKIWGLLVIAPLVALVGHWIWGPVRERIGRMLPKPSGAHGTARVGDRADVDQHTDLERAAW